jgi:hypothetical protein
MLTGMTPKISRFLVLLCISMVFALGISCHVYASPHTHGFPSGSHDDDHHDKNASSSFDDAACLVAVIPSIEPLLNLSALKHDVLLPVVKPLVPAFEFDIPPRSSL